MKTPRLSRTQVVTLIVAAFLVAAAAGLYAYVTSGGMTARQKPWRVEAAIAHALVNLGIHRADRARTNPASTAPDSADVAAGRDLYRNLCQTCHGVDGKAGTAVGRGLFPAPADLSRAALKQRKRTDGELFFLIRNGIRNTGMPAWNLSDPQIWDLIAFVRALPPTASVDDGAKPLAASTSGAYVGSFACKHCHEDIYARWEKTPMANVVRDPRAHPDAVIPDFSQPNPLVNFTVDDVALVYGSRWKQRYFKKVGDDYFPFPAQWDVTHKLWRRYFVKDDWWAPLYPPDNFQRPTGPLCDGCHSVNYDIEKKTVTEWNVGCERCHGPGADHAAHPTAANIVNPLRLDRVAANDVCVQCHSQGRPPGNPIRGQYYDWPVGYDVTKSLKDFWALEGHKLGDTTFTHFPDGTAHKNRMQGNDFALSVMYTRGVTCFSCHDVHGTPYPGNVRKASTEICFDCHSPGSANGPRAPTLAEHTHHAAGRAGSECIACHMPKIAETIADVNVRSHTFRFVSPAEGERLHIPDACSLCHADKPPGWATAALRSWATTSPWRVGE